MKIKYRTKSPQRQTPRMRVRVKRPLRGFGELDTELESTPETSFDPKIDSILPEDEIIYVTSDDTDEVDPLERTMTTTSTGPENGDLTDHFETIQSTAVTTIETEKVPMTKQKKLLIGSGLLAAAFLIGKLGK